MCPILYQGKTRARPESQRHEWSYRVEYEEQYETLPLLTNKAVADYRVFQDLDTEVRHQ